MIEIAQFYDPEEAQIAQGYLRSLGLKVELADTNTLGNMPELRIGLGGYRLMADEKDAHMARTELAKVQDQPTGPVCAQCSQRDMVRVRDRKMPVLLLVFAIVSPFSKASRELRCRACGHKQPDESIRDD